MTLVNLVYMFRDGIILYQPTLPNNKPQISFLLSSCCFLTIVLFYFRNYCCIALLLYRVGLPKLRILFKNEWNNVGGFAKWTDCPRNGADLATKYKYLNYEKGKVLSGNTASWDLSLFVKALLNSTPPLIPSTNIAIVNSLKSLKKTRDKVICHTSSGKIETAVFQTMLTDTCSALTNIGATQSELDKVKQGTNSLAFKHLNFLMDIFYE